MRNTTRITSIVAAAALSLGLAACGSQPMYPATSSSSYPASNNPANAYPTAQQYPGNNGMPAYVEYGRVTNIQVFQTQEPARTTGAGAVIGGIAGAVIGNQIGSGSGRDAARIVGIAGGAIAGNAIEKNSRTQVVDTYRVSVQTDNGTLRAYDLTALNDLRAGDRVRIENGQIYRY